jgi:hypothetical protein
MNYFLDTEFLEGTQKKRLFNIPYGNTKNTIDLISIGIVDEDGREFYEVSKDFNLKEAWNRFQMKQVSGDARNRYSDGIKEYWIRENVLKPIFIDFLKLQAEYLMKQRRITGYAPALNSYFNYRNFKKLLNRFGKSNKEIAEKVYSFVTFNFKELGNIKHENKIKYDISNPLRVPEFYAYYADYDWVVFCWIFGKMIDLPKGFPMYCIDLKQMLDEKVESVFIDDGQGNDLNKGRLEWIKTLPYYPIQEKETQHNALHDAKWNLKLYKFLKNLQ